MKNLTDLKEGDYIAFGFNYHGGEPNEIIVDTITSFHGDKCLVHFLYGHHSLGEFVNTKDIIAIGNPEGESKINGWGGKYDLINPNHPLLTK